MAEQPAWCARTEELAPDLALGLLTGVDRAEALTHVVGCGACRSAVEDLAEVADRLLVLAPAVPPPPGFESTVLAALTAAAGDGSRRRRRFAGRARLVLAVAASVAAITLAFSMGAAQRSPTTGERRQASMVAAGTEADVVGTVSLYSGEEGRQAWLLVSMPKWATWPDDQHQQVSYRLRVELKNGERVELGGVHLAADGSWGATTSLDPDAVAAASIINPSGRVMCTGQFA